MEGKVGSGGIVYWQQIVLGGLDRGREVRGVGEFCVDSRFC